MAFNIDIPGPKLIDLGLYGKLSDIGSAFKESRDEALARDVFANLQSDDPASVDEAIKRLGHIPKYAALAQRMAESHQQAQERAATQEIARRGVVVREGELQRGLDADKTAAEQEAAFQQIMRNRPALPPATEDAAPITTRPRSEDQPTTYTPGGRAVPERFPWWDVDAAAPGPQSGLDPSTLSGSATSNTLLGAGEGDRLVEPTSPSPEGPKLRPAGMRERALDAEIEYLSNLAAAAPDNARREAIKVRLGVLDKERTDLRKRREDALAKQEQSILAREQRAAAVEEEPKKELGKKLVAETKSLAEQDNILREIGAIARTPGYTGGMRGRLAATGSSIIQQVVPESIASTGFVQGLVDKGTLANRVDVLGRELTKAASGEKGLGTQGFTDKDRDFIGSINPSIDDPQQMLQLKAEAGLAVGERRKKIVGIIRKGLAEGKTVAEIDEGVAAYAEKYPLFVGKDGKLTERGRKVNPALARSMGQDDKKSAPTAVPSSGPPREAIQYLRSNPQLAPAFEQKYGLPPGSAQQYLGGT